MVVGAYGMHPLRDFAIGTCAERLLHRTDRPVLVVKRKPAGPYRQVLAPVDLSPDARAAVSLARQVAPNSRGRTRKPASPPLGKGRARA